VLAVTALAAVVLLGGFLSLAVGSLAVMYSDPCGSEGRGPICSTGVQLAVGLLPLAGWAVAVVVSAIAVRRVGQRDRGGWRPMAVGVAVLVTSWLIAVGIAEQPVNP
jgi:hypothetical protein